MPYNFVVSVHISSFLNLLQLKNLYCNQTDASLWRLRRNKDILYYTTHHYTSLYITVHHYPLLSLAIYKKKGDRRSPANYRGINLTSCLGKLFTSILQSRLNKYIEIHNILNPEQFGFRPNARTTDSLFILQQLLHKYTKQHEKLYVGFIDYEKAFDSVWQSGMIHKLQKEGIKGKFLKVIKSMYSFRSCGNVG